MGSACRDQKLSLIDDIYINGDMYSFDMLAYIIGYKNVVAFGKESYYASSPFYAKGINILYIRATEVEKVIKSNKPVVFTGRLSIAGLNAPMPMPYAELMNQRTQSEDFAMSEYLNIFQTRLLGISYQISKRRFNSLIYNLQDNMLLKVVTSFLGEDDFLSKNSFFRYGYLFWTKEKSAHGLSELLKAFLDTDVIIEEFCTSKISKHSVTLLGKNCNNLGCDAELGRYIYINNFCVRIHIYFQDFSYLQYVCDDKEIIVNLKYLIKKYLGEYCEYFLYFYPTKVSDLYLNKSAKLGKNTWFASEKTLEKMNVK